MAAKADETSGGETLDKVLSKLDALHGRMDAMELSGKDPLKKDDARKDDDDDDDKKKDDDEEEDKKKDDDDEEEGEKKEEKKEDSRKDQAGAPKGNVGATAPPVVADKKKDGRKDDGDLEMKHEGKELVHKGDRKDGRKDDDDDDDDDKRADSLDEMRRIIREQGKTIKRLEGRMRPISDEDHIAFAEAQAKADSVFNGFGKRAPRPLEGEGLLDYRKRLATHLKSHSAQWKGVKFSQLPEAAFAIAETQVYADAAAAASNPTDLTDGELREVTRRDPRTNLTTTVFYGRESFVKGLGRPGRRVASFRTQHST